MTAVAIARLQEGRNRVGAGAAGFGRAFGRLGLRGKLAVGVIALYLLVALFGEAVAPYSPTAFNLTSVLRPPSAEHLFGTDGFGRDVFSRTLAGARSILGLAAAATLLGVGTGWLLGASAGYVGGFIDEATMRAVDVLLALPGLLLALLIMTSAGSSPSRVLVSIAIVFVPKAARIARAATLPIRALGFVDAAKMRGDRWFVVVTREIIPNLRAELTVELCLRFAYALLLISSLGFLGFGVQPPAPDWGLMISDSRNFVSVAPWMMLFPAVAIGLIVVAVSSLADAVTDEHQRAAR